MSVFLTDDEINTFAKNGFSENDIQDTINGYRSEGLDDNAIRSRIDQRLNSWKPAQPKPQAKPQTSSINQPVKKQLPDRERIRQREKNERGSRTSGGAICPSSFCNDAPEFRYLPLRPSSRIPSGSGPSLRTQGRLCGL